ncbi:MAG: hypothetical protein ACEPOZ_06540 [Marinifilaceae bacterium]
MRKTVLFLLISFWCFAGMGQGVEWVNVHSEKSKIKFKVPGQVQRDTSNMDGVKVEKFQYRDVANIFGVIASDFSAVGIDFSKSDNQEFYESMKQGSLVTSDAILVSEQTIAYKRMLGKEIKYTLLVKGKEYTYYKRFFFRGNFVYQVAIGGPTRMQNLLLDKKDLFFNSLEFE